MRARVSCGAKEPGEYVLRIALPKESTGRLIGPRGTSIKKLREETNAKVFVDNETFEGRAVERGTPPLPNGEEMHLRSAFVWSVILAASCRLLCVNVSQPLSFGTSLYSVCSRRRFLLELFDNVAGRGGSKSSGAENGFRWRNCLSS